jgi:hypothetical protein
MIGTIRRGVDPARYANPPAATSPARRSARFDPAEARDHDGKWTDGATGLVDKAAHAITHALQGDGHSGGGEVTGRDALTAAGARLPDRGKGSTLDNDAQLTFTHDPGWKAKPRAGTSRAVRLYRNSTYRKINGYLRDPDNADEHMDIRETRDGPTTREHVLYDHVLLIDQGMEASPLSQPVQVWRGVGDGQATFGDAWSPDMTGAEWDEAGFPSTSADPDIARLFSTDAILRLHVPEGVGAIQLDGWKSSANHNAEAELLLQRGLHMKVIGDSIQVVGTGGGVTWVRDPVTGDETMQKLPPPTRRVLDVEVTPGAEE